MKRRSRATPRQASAWMLVLAVLLGMGGSTEPFPERWKPERPKARKLDSPPPVFAQLGYDPSDP